MVHFILQVNADNPKISTIYVAKELLELQVSLAQGVVGSEPLRYLDS